MSRLSQADVEKLLSNPSEKTRAETAEKIASDFSPEKMTFEQRVLASEVLKIMADDAATIVRKALSENLCKNPNIPREVAVKLANDDSSISVPIIKFSEVLTDEDLLDIINSQSEDKQAAVAEREIVSETVSDALIETNNKNVVKTLMSNQGAEISENSFSKVIDRFGDDVEIQTPMVHRNNLPVGVTERLIAIVSDSLKDHLINAQVIPEEMADDIVSQTRERAVLGLSTFSSLPDIKKLVKKLVKCDQLSPSIMLRALCIGDVTFFEAALSELSGVNLKNTRLLIHDEGGLGFEKLYNKTTLDKKFFQIFRITLNTLHEIEIDISKHGREKYASQLIERILTRVYQEDEILQKDSEYLFNRLSDLKPKTAEQASAG